MRSNQNDEQRQRRALHRSEVIGAIPALISSAESVMNRVTKHATLDDWALAREGYVERSWIMRKLLDLVATDTVNISLHLVRIAANATLIVAPARSTVLRGACGIASGLSTALLSPRERYGTDGADQATTICQLSNGLARASGSHGSAMAAIWNVSLQSTMSYAAAGYVKLAGRSWRDGTAVPDILRTRSYGHDRMWRTLNAHPRLGRMLTWGVLAFEGLFPVIYVLPMPLARALATGALGFHVVNGYAMGLWRFIFAFASMHPQLLLTVETLRLGGGRRDVGAITPILFGGATASLLMISAISTGLRARRVSTGNSRALTAHSRLAFDFHNGGSDLPVVVFENGLLGLPEHYAWIRRRLHECGFSTLVYTRAGYGASVDARPRRSRYSLDDSVTDLEALIEQAVPQGRTVVLVGHSMGGEIARRAAVSARAPIAGVVYLDPTHPAQMARSAGQRGGVDDFTESLTTYRVNTSLSLGTFLSTPTWVRTLPRDARASALDQYRDARLWRAGLHEWNSMQVDLSGKRTIEKLRVPGLLISAGRTLASDAEIEELHDEILGAHSFDGEAGKRVVLDDVTHDSMLTNANHASRSAAAIVEFVTNSVGVRT